MAITRAQQAKQMLQKGGRIGLKGGADASMKDFDASANPDRPGGPIGRDRPGPNVSAGGASFQDLGPAPTKEVRDRQKKLYEDQFYAKGQLPPVGSRPVDVKTRLDRKRRQGILDFINRSIGKDLYRSGFLGSNINTRFLGGAVPTAGSILAEIQASYNPDLLENEINLFDEDSVREIASVLSKTKTGITGVQASALKNLRKNIKNREELKEKGMTQDRFEELYPQIKSGPDRDGPEPIIPIVPKLIKEKEEEEEAKRNLGGLSARIGGSLFDFDTFAADGGRIGYRIGGVGGRPKEGPVERPGPIGRDKPNDREGSSNRERGIMSRGLGPKGTTGNIRDFRDTGPDDRSSFRQTLNQFRVSKGLETGEPSFSEKFKTGLRGVLDLIAMGVISPLGAAELSPEELEQLKKDAGVTTGKTITAGAVPETVPDLTNPDILNKIAIDAGLPTETKGLVFKEEIATPKSERAIKSIQGLKRMEDETGQDIGLGVKDIIGLGLGSTEDLSEDQIRSVYDMVQADQPSRIMAAGGGIASIDREAFILGGIAKGLKKATRAVKKIAKSPIGKAAIGAALFKFGGGSGIVDLIRANPKTSIFLASLAAGAMTPKQDEGKFDLDEYYATGQTGDVEPFARIAGSNFDFYGGQVAAADGGLMRLGYQEGGDAEPVAKKTMPLIDMDGMEKDYRETGGFVEMGRMERADDVPARLSKNEFVFTADAVRNAGEGDIDKGAEVMYNMIKNLEAGGEVSEESQGLEGARKMFQTSQRLGEVI